jgi:cobalamin biosynthesis protein CbiG
LFRCSTGGLVSYLSPAYRGSEFDVGVVCLASMNSYWLSGLKFSMVRDGQAGVWHPNS